MSTIEPDPALFGARLVGAVAGALVALAYMLPKSAREAAARAFASFASGLVFGAPAGVAIITKLEIADRLGPAETLLTGSAAASVGAWWVLGILVRIAGRYGRGHH